jgi:hypothetical protein
MKCSQLAFIVCVVAIAVQGVLPPENLAQVRATIDPDIPPISLGIRYPAD